MTNDTYDARPTGPSVRPLEFGGWPLSILRYRRALRVLDAAAASLSAIAEATAVRGTSRPEDESLRRIEVEGILDTLERELMPFALPISRSVRDQWRNIKEAEKAAGWNSECTAVLHRALEAQRRILVASAPAFSPSAVPKTGSLPPCHTPIEGAITKPDQPQAFKPDEAALLAGLIDKFYGSSAFKLIGGALVAAALLAGAGTVYLGTHTLTLRDDLEKTEAKAKSDINASAQRIQDSITTQSNLLKAADDAITRVREEFKQNVATRVTQIDKIMADFTEKSATLRADAITAAIATLDSQLKDPVSTLSNALKKKGEDATEQMDTLSKDVGALEERRAAIDNAVRSVEDWLKVAAPTLERLKKEGPLLDALMRNFDNLKTKEKAASDTLQNTAAMVQRIKDAVPELDTTIRDLKDVKAKENALSDALMSVKTRADDAASQAQAAEQSASLAETARGAAMSAVEMIQKEAAGQQLALGGTRTRIEALNKEVAEAESKLRNAGQVASDVTALKQQVSALTRHVDDLEARLQKLQQPPKAPPPGSPQSQAELSPQQWFEIQQNLAARGFNPGKVDGRLGNNTRQAIRLFQGATNQPVTGILTAAQIEQLLTRP